MMLVKTALKKSSIHGMGIFADENIKKGTIVWKFNPIIDKKITKEEMYSLPLMIQEYIKSYAYLNKKGERILCGDHARFFNHSSTPNCWDNDADKEEEDITIAARDIKKGEELTSDYFSFDHSPEEENEYAK